MTSPGRAGIPDPLAAKIAVRHRRRCPLCYGLSSDTGVKRGQIAHLDRNPRNNRAVNLMFLCLDHHSLYDSRSHQARGITAAEVWRYSRELSLYTRGIVEAWPDVEERPSRPSRRANTPLGCDPETYRMRIPIFHAVNKTVSAALSDLQIEIGLLMAFLRETNEVQFLFGTDVSEYLRRLYKSLVELRRITRRLADGPRLDPKESAELSDREAAIIRSLSAHYDEWITLLTPYLRLR